MGTYATDSASGDGPTSPRTNLELTDSAVIGYCRPVAERMSRSTLQHILVEARLIPKQASRDELRQICPNSAAWIRLVQNALAAPESRPAGLRALSHAISAHTASSTFDHRVQSCLRKARQAAEREDLTRIGRELEKLREYSVELGIPELNQPGVLLFLSSGSDRARSAVEQALSGDILIRSSSKNAIALPEAKTAVYGPTQTDITTDTRTEIIRPARDGFEGLRSRLQDFAQPLPPALKWSTNSFAVSVSPIQPIPWPDCSGLSTSLNGLKAFLQSEFDNLNQQAASVVSLSQLKVSLDTSRLSLSGRLAGLSEDIGSIEDDIRLKIESALNSLQPEMAERLSRIRGELAIPGSLIPKGDIDDAIRLNNEIIAQKTESIRVSIAALETTAPYLPPEAQQILEAKVRNLVLHFRPEELKKVVQETEVKTEEPRRVRSKLKQAAARVLAMIDELEPMELPVEIVDRVEQAVAQGDAEGATECVREAVSRPITTDSEKTKDILAGDREQGRAPIVIAACPALIAETAGFSPRDRFTSSAPNLPEGSEALAHFLREQCLGAVRRHSKAGAIDNALDILYLASRATAGGDYWCDTGLIILAALPPDTLAMEGWGESLAETLSGSLRAQDQDTLLNYVRELTLQATFEDAISERFVHSELSKSVDRLAGALAQAVSLERPYLLEDVAKSVGRGVAFGDKETCQGLLLALCRATGISAPLTNQIQKLLQNEQAGIRAADRNQIPDWISEGILAFHVGLADRSRLSQRTPGRPGTLQLRVPVSVSKNGGFGYPPGADDVEFALLLSNLQSTFLSSVEVSFSKSRNPWLESDVVSSVGNMPPNSRALVQFKAKLRSELAADATYELGWQARYREPGIRETRFEDSRIDSLSFVQAKSLVLANYENAGGRPLILEGDALRLSSGSVRRALSEIVSGLAGKGIAALIIGRRRRGKTSILQTIAKQPDVRARYAVIADSWEDIPSLNLDQTLQHLGMVFDRAIRTIGVEIDSLADRLSTGSVSAWAAIQNWLDDLERRLQAPVRLLLLIDEFQKWITLLDPLSRTRVFAILRGLFNRSEGGNLSISIVLSGLSSIREFMKSSADFQNAFKVLPVEAFSLSETETLIRSNITVEFDTRAVSRVRDLSGGNPFLINLLCNDLVVHLREQNRAYCLPQDVEKVVRAQLEDRENSRVWSFLQYLLKEGEEDHASDIRELPTLIALAYTRRIRGTGREFIGVDEIEAELSAAEVACDSGTLERHLACALQNELLLRRGNRYAFANGWLAEWLSVNDTLLPILAEEDKELVLGRFRLGTPISQGGQASTFEGQDTHASNRAVVIKIYPRVYAGGGPALSVMQEAKLLHSIEHTAVVHCIECGADPEKGDVIVLERVQGDSLRKLLSDRPKYANALIGTDGNLATQVKFIEQIAAALSECHRKGIVHKDLKPENIMASSLVGLWSPRIVDFGLATYVDEQAQEYKTQHSYTPGYVAPERYKGEGRRSSADIYSLGVVTYELLTGRHPFEEEVVNVRQAQEQGQFQPAKLIRPEIPIALSELISEMLNPDPSCRPNAFTLAGRLSVALQISDWEADFESAKRAYSVDADAETACDYGFRAVFSASEAEQRNVDYVTALDLLIDAADSCGRLVQYGPELVQPTVKAAVFHQAGKKSFEDLVSKVLATPAVDGRSRENQSDALRALIETLKGIQPKPVLLEGIHLLLNGLHPAVWARREEAFLLGLGYHEAELLPADVLGRWCVAVARRMREGELNLVGAQLWLRRTEFLGLSGLSELTIENDIVQKLLARTAVPEILPMIAKQEPASSVVGENERGHLQVDRIMRWVERLLKLHPYVQAVRRVKRDPGPALTPTRLLGIDNISQHLSAALESIEPSRIIPAVLDESYCIPKGRTVLRINIVLPPNTSIGQREAAMKLLAADISLFGAAD